MFYAPPPPRLPLHHPLQRPPHFPPTHLPVPVSAGLMAGVPGHPHHRPVSLPHSLLGVPPLPRSTTRPSLGPVAVGNHEQAAAAAAAASLATSMLPVSRLPAGPAYPILSPPLYAAGFNPNPFRAAMAARVGGGMLSPTPPPHLPGGGAAPHHFMPPFSGAPIRTPMLPMLSHHGEIPISLAAAAALGHLRAPVSGVPGIPPLPPPPPSLHQQNQLAIRQEDNFQFNHQVYTVFSICMTEGKRE